MRNFLFALIPVLMMCVYVGAQEPSARDGASAAKSLDAARQLIVVTTKDWNAVAGVLRRYERRGARSAWRAVGDPVDVVVGRNGLGWGTGLHDKTAATGPIKKEGDGKAPAGVFKLSAAFGYAAPAEAKRLKLPYVSLTESIECVDDTSSTHYNRILDRAQTSDVDWNSSERMRQQGELYRWGVVVDHNAAPPLPGAGSCIFLHIWSAPTKGTAGCTAMERSNLEELLNWLDAKKNPALAQLPEAEYARLKGAWRLPVK